MYYSTDEIASILKYKTPQTFLQAIRNKDRNELLDKIWGTKLSGKVGKRILWKKSKVDQILK